MAPAALSASFRDPSGFLYRDDDGTLLRQINRSYQADYESLNDSGLYAALVKDKQLIEHDVADIAKAATSDAYSIIQPHLIPLISYPYEWAFSAFRDAALLTLDIQTKALNHGMSLKDASAFNVQFIGCRPIFIDSLSFENYKEGRPWIAYGQFCRHFLAPLMLMAHVDVDLSRLLQLYVDGVPLDLTAKLLPWKTKLSINSQLHIHMHAKMVRKHESTSSQEQASVGSLPLKKQLLLLDNLKSLLTSLKWIDRDTEWGNYYQDNTYTDETARNKTELVKRFLQVISPKTAWDLGANTGFYSKLAVDQGAYCCAWDIDPACVEQAYLHGMSRGENRLLPLRIDLANPSPSLGWAHEERESLVARGPVDIVMGLALIHHLAIANNVPLGSIARYFSSLGDHLIIEWVPKSDVQVQRLLRSREDIFHQYKKSHFEAAFEEYYRIEESHAVGNDNRVLYRMSTLN
jgi:hypothetical protein